MNVAFALLALVQCIREVPGSECGLRRASLIKAFRGCPQFLQKNTRKRPLLKALQLVTAQLSCH